MNLLSLPGLGATSSLTLATVALEPADKTGTSVPPRWFAIKSGSSPGEALSSNEESELGRPLWIVATGSAHPAGQIYPKTRRFVQ